MILGNDSLSVQLYYRIPAMEDLLDFIYIGKSTIILTALGHYLVDFGT